MQTGIRYEFSEIPTEDGIEAVNPPQMIVVRNKDYAPMVRIYLMLNNALRVTGGTAEVVEEKIELSYAAHSPSGAFTASRRLIRLQFVFPDLVRSLPEFVFLGQQHAPSLK